MDSNPAGRRLKKRAHHDGTDPRIPLTPAIVAAFAVFFILVWLKPQFVQRKQCSKIALPSLNYSAVFALSTLAFLGVLVIPKII